MTGSVQVIEVHTSMAYNEPVIEVKTLITGIEPVIGVSSNDWSNTGHQGLYLDDQ